MTLHQRRTVFHLLDAIDESTPQVIISWRGEWRNAKITSLEPDFLRLSVQALPAELQLDPDGEALGVCIRTAGRWVTFTAPRISMEGPFSLRLPMPMSVETEDQRSRSRWLRPRLKHVKFVPDGGTSLPFDVVDLSEAGVAISDAEGCLGTPTVASLCRFACP